MGKKNELENIKSFSQQRGITLIALVITIIILIILATVTLNVVLGEGGLIDRAQLAKDMTEEAVKGEQEALNSLMDEMTNIMAEDSTTPKSEIGEAKESGEKFENTTKLTDDSGDEVWIPGGFGVDEDSATDADDGIVITDGTNEFVWIPVLDYTTMYQEAPGTKLTGVETITNVYSKLRIREEEQAEFVSGIPNSLDLREPDILSYEAEYAQMIGYDSAEELAQERVADYMAVYNSIKKYNGFYVGRYELTGTTELPTVEKNKDVLSIDWDSLRNACLKVVNTDYAGTTMIYGNQWDEMMNWLIYTGGKTEEEVNKDSSSWGNYNKEIGTGQETPAMSGSSEKWKANNIYDLAGNYRDLTQEAGYENYRISRGGGYHEVGNEWPANSRLSFDTWENHDSLFTARVTLYIK